MTFDPSAAAAPGSGAFGLPPGPPNTPETARVVLVPVGFEATCSFGGGTAGGPAAVLEASRQVDLFDVETGRPYEGGIAMVEADPRVDAWNERALERARPVIEAGGAGDDPALREAADEVDEAGAAVNAWLEGVVEPLLARGALVGVVGGDHSVPFASIRAHARRWPGLGVLHVDAHADLRVAYEGLRWSHASIMDNVLREVPEVARLVGVAYRDLSEEEHERCRTDPRIAAFPEVALRRRLLGGEPWLAVARDIVGRLPEHVYVSFDIDGLDPALCPHTGTPVPGGLSWAEATALLAEVVASGRRIVGFDLCEVTPDPTGGGWDENVGARLLYKLIGFALVSQA